MQIRVPLLILSFFQIAVPACQPPTAGDGPETSPPEGFKGFKQDSPNPAGIAGAGPAQEETTTETNLEYVILEDEDSDEPILDNTPVSAPEDPSEKPAHEDSSFSLGEIVSFVTPGDSTVNNIVTMRLTTSPEVKFIEYVAEDSSGQFCWALGDSDNPANGFQFTYAFNTTGNRIIGARAFGANGNAMGTFWKAVNIGEPAPVEANKPSFDISFISPAPTAVTNPVVLKVSTQGPINRVRYLADGALPGQNWLLGEVQLPDSGYSLVYNFSETGLRTIRAQAINDEGAVVSEDMRVIDVQSLPEEVCPSGQTADCNNLCVNETWIGDGYCDDGTNYEVVLDCAAFDFDGGDCDAEAQACESGYVQDCNGSCGKKVWIGDGYCDNGSQYPIDFDCNAFGGDEGDCASEGSDGSQSSPSAIPYFYQYANQWYPGSSCQNTSIAMLLKHYGWQGVPDDITSKHGKNKAQSPAGLVQVFNDMAASGGISERLQAITNGTIDGLQSLLNSGQPVIIHGYFTSFGHVVLATSYNAGTYTVNDPAGKWNQQFKGGYPYGYNSTVGKGIHYPSGAFELAVSSTNGSNYEPLWYYKVLP